MSIKEQLVDEISELFINEQFIDKLISQTKDHNEISNIILKLEKHLLELQWEKFKEKYNLEDSAVVNYQDLKKGEMVLLRYDDFKYESETCDKIKIYRVGFYKVYYTKTYQGYDVIHFHDCLRSRDKSFNRIFGMDILPGNLYLNNVNPETDQGRTIYRLKK